jgi:hypothetical protein
MLERRPSEPTTTTRRGFDISGAAKNRCIASMKMEKHRARRKTPLIKAARISARCHP